MVVDASKSFYISNVTAAPAVKTASCVANGQLREGCGYITPTAAAEAASTYRFCRVPSNARISQVLISCAAFTTGGAVDVGLYDCDGGAVVDRDLFASAVALTAAKDKSDITHESGEYTLAEAEKPLWEVLGLSTDPMKEYDVVAYVTTAFNGGQPMLLHVRYAV